MKYLLLALLLCNCASKQRIKKTYDFKHVKLNRVIDGDTFKADIKYVNGLLGKDISVRINGIDTPEVRTKDQCEKVKGTAAKLYLESKLKNTKFYLENCGRGKFFRIICDVIANGENIGDLMVQKGYAYFYSGGTKPEIDYCKED